MNEEIAKVSETIEKEDMRLQECQMTGQEGDGTFGFVCKDGKIAVLPSAKVLELFISAVGNGTTSSQSTALSSEQAGCDCDEAIEGIEAEIKALEKENAKLNAKVQRV